MKGQAMELDTILANHVSDKGLEDVKKFQNLTVKTYNPTKKWAKDKTFHQRNYVNDK